MGHEPGTDRQRLARATQVPYFDGLRDCSEDVTTARSSGGTHDGFSARLGTLALVNHERRSIWVEIPDPMNELDPYPGRHSEESQQHDINQKQPGLDSGKWAFERDGHQDATR